jgi:flagellar hook-length control protein FliK
MSTPFPPRSTAQPIASAPLSAAATGLPAVTTPLPVHAPVAHAQKLSLMLGQVVARSIGNQVAMAWLLPLHSDPQTWQELLAMQAAVWQRLRQQQADWTAGCTQLIQDYGQLRQANTLSKFVEQEYDAVAQFGALVKSQAADLAGLVENVQVDFGYWVSQKQPVAD